MVAVQGSPCAVTARVYNYKHGEGAELEHFVWQICSLLLETARK
jgi:hypothetical protein